VESQRIIRIKEKVRKTTFCIHILRERAYALFAAIHGTNADIYIAVAHSIVLCIFGVSEGSFFDIIPTVLIDDSA
jgi:hypothetical protein